MAIIQTSCTQTEALTQSTSYPNLIFYATDTNRIVKEGAVYSNYTVESPIELNSNEEMSIDMESVKGDIFNTTKTESQASLLTDNIMYLTTDTNNIVLNGNVYGRGSEIGGSFAFAPNISSQSSWDTNKIYITPSATSGVCDVYAHNGSSWSSSGTFSVSIPLTASSISYDRTNTPSLGNGDLQSAVESLASKPDEWMDDFTKEIIPTTTAGASYGLNSVATKYSYTMTGNTITSDTTSGWRMYWTLNKVPKGTWVHIKITYSTGHAHAWLIASNSPQEYYVNNSNDLVGFVFDDRIFYHESAKNIEGWFKMPYDAYLLYRYCTSNVSVALSVTYQPIQLLIDMMNEYYTKGIVDGGSMASIAGLGYDITDYLSFTKLAPIDKTGFAYGCDLRRQYNKTAPSGTSVACGLTSNSKLVYLPSADYSGVTTVGSTTASQAFLSYNTTISTLPPDLNLSGNKTGAYFMYVSSGATNPLSVIEQLGTIKFTNLQYAFRYRTGLTRIGDISANTDTCGNMQFTLDHCSNLVRLEGISIKSVTNWYASGAPSLFRLCSKLRYLVLKDIGYKTLTGNDVLKLQDCPWGINDEANPDARQSLVDSLLTYSYNRTTDPDNLGVSGVEYIIKIPSASLAVLTEEEKTAITAKGYTLTTS